MVEMGVPRVINRALGITPTVAGFGTDPTNLGNVTDNDWTTVTGTGSTTLGAGGDIGYLNFDLGAVRTVLVNAKVGVWRDAGTMNLYWYWSTDGIAWKHTNHVVIGSTTSAVEEIIWPLLGMLRTRYFRLRFYLSAAGTGNVKIYEVQALEFSEVVGQN